MTFLELHKAIHLLADENSEAPKLSIHAILVLMECLKHSEHGISGLDLMETLDMPKSTLWRAMAYWTEYTEGGKGKGKGWLTRDLDELDGRAIVIHVTPVGKRIKNLLIGKGK